MKVKKFVPKGRGVIGKNYYTSKGVNFTDVLREADARPIISDDPVFRAKYGGLKKDEIPDEVYSSWSIRFVGGVHRWYGSPAQPPLPDAMRNELHSRQRDARILGVSVPIGITEYGLSIFSEKSETLPSRSPSPRLESSSSPERTVQKFTPKEKGPGVIDTIVKVLTEEASKARPMTKAALLKRLVKLIPGREPEKMASTVRAQLAASGLKAKGVAVRDDGKTGDDRGYWIRKAK